jgi:hypothetical protein
MIIPRREKGGGSLPLIANNKKENSGKSIDFVQLIWKRDDPSCVQHNPAFKFRLIWL